MTLPVLPDRPLQHSYHQTTGEYLGSSVPEYDAMHLNKSNVLQFMDLPFTTFEPLPEFGANERPVFAGGAWHVLKDFRGQVWFNGAAPVVIDRLGDPAEGGLTPQPVVVEDPNAILNQKRAELLTKLSAVSQQIGSYRSNETIPPELLDRRKKINDELNALEPIATE